MKYLFYLILLFLFIACNNSNTKNSLTDSASFSNAALITDFPLLNEIDSIDIHFFPNINDLKIYKRIGVSKKELIDSLLVQQLNNSSIPQKNCEFDIKYFCFSKKNFIKTIYVATLQHCNYIGYVKSGGVIQLFQIKEAVLQQLKQLEQQAQ